MTVDFKFSLGEKVTTLSGDKGFIETCAIESLSKKYYVVCANDVSRWFYEEHLTLGWKENTIHGLNKNGFSEVEE